MLVAGFLFAAVIFVHYECLRLISRVIRQQKTIPRRNLLRVMFGVLTAHILEIAVYAMGYWFADSILNAGHFAGVHVLYPIDYFYFSTEAYTSLGVGNLYPVGDVRLLAGMETLTGLLLIGWSTSFTFVAMTRYWDEFSD
jgi:hypothetical protein